MTTVPQVADALQMVLGDKASEAGRKSGFIKREREFGGDTFAQTLVFGWSGNPAAAVAEMSQLACAVGVKVSRQGVAQRFTAEAAEMMRPVLEEAIQVMLGAEAVPVAILQRFSGVYILDSTIIQLPDSLLSVWQGSGGGQPEQENAGVKLSVRWDYLSGRLEGPYLPDARQHDQQAPVQEAAVAPGSLRLADLGYFNLAVLEQIGQQQAYWLTRYKTGTVLTTLKGR